MMPLDEFGDGEHQMRLERKARMLAFLIARNRPRKLSKVYERNNKLRAKGVPKHCSQLQRAGIGTDSPRRRESSVLAVRKFVLWIFRPAIPIHRVFSMGT